MEAQIHAAPTSDPGGESNVFTLRRGDDYVVSETKTRCTVTVSN